MFITEEKWCGYTLLCHYSWAEHQIFTTKARKNTGIGQILKKKANYGLECYLICEPE